MLNADGVEDESVGQQYLETHNNWPAQMWIQTSYNTSGNNQGNATAGTDNTGGGGGGGGGQNPGSAGKNGGSGIVILRYRYQ